MVGRRVEAQSVEALKVRYPWSPVRKGNINWLSANKIGQRADSNPLRPPHDHLVGVGTTRASLVVKGISSIVTGLAERRDVKSKSEIVKWVIWVPPSSAWGRRHLAWH